MQIFASVDTENFDNRRTKRRAGFGGCFKAKK
jgi:hypothetical protein